MENEYKQEHLNDVHSYLIKNHNASLNDYYKYLQKQLKEENPDIIKLYNWHKQFDGKYIKLKYDFKHQQHAYCERFKFKCPSIKFFQANKKVVNVKMLLSNSDTNISISKDTSINILDLNCPYYMNNSFTTMEVISEDEFNKIYNLIDKSIKEVKCYD